MTETVPISPWDGGPLYDKDGRCVGVYCAETGRGMFAHTFFIDEKVCTIESAIVHEWHDGDEWETELSCGHTVPLKPENFKRCIECGARVIRHDTPL